MALSWGGLQVMCGDMFGPHPGCSPFQEAVLGPGPVSLWLIVQTGSGSSSKASEFFGIKQSSGFYKYPAYQQLAQIPQDPDLTSPSMETPVSYLSPACFILTSGCLEYPRGAVLPAHCNPICAKMTLTSLTSVSTLAHQEGKGSEKLVPAVEPTTARCVTLLGPGRVASDLTSPLHT